MKFSVIIPTYNRALLIEDTIQSILNQSFTDFEIIVVDDGSTDHTEEVVKRFSSDPRFSYHKKINGERGIARNYGAALARGEYVNFFDSDDLAYPVHLQSAYDFIVEKNKPEVFHTLYDTQIDGVVKPTQNVFSSDVNDIIISDNILSCNNVFIRKDIASLHPFPEDRRMAVAEDWALWLQLASRYKFYHHPVLTSTIVYHDNRSVFDFNVDKIITRDELLLAHLWTDEAFLKRYSSRLTEFKSRRYVFIALFLAIKRRKLESIHYLNKALKTNFSSIVSKRFIGTLKTLLLKW